MKKLAEFFAWLFSAKLFGEWQNCRWEETMRKLTTLIIMASVCGLFALPMVPGESDRAIHEQNLSSGTLMLKTTNYACEKDLMHHDGTRLSYGGGIWISGVKARRDAEGELLYWLHYPPSAAQQEAVNMHNDLWNPDLLVARDSLTSVAFDGDKDLYEFLPAYNPLMSVNSDLSYLYNQYNTQDIVLQSFLGIPSPLPFAPFDSDTFCFTIPEPEAFDTPGIFTNSAYYYDYCPFGTAGDRDWGSARNSNTHMPLGLAVHQETFAWDIQQHSDMLITKYTLYNTNLHDEIENMAISYYLDADIGPADWGVQIAADDKSGYVKGAGYEFAYSCDADFDGGISPYYVANKVMIPDFTGERDAWYWKMGHGPDDANATNYYTSNQTPNEKYWLATGRNPNLSRYVSMRLDTADEYEQPVPNDTRFLNTIYGGADTALSLAPGASLSFYVVNFIGESLDALKDKSLFIEDFIASGLQIDPNQDYVSFPHLGEIECLYPDTFRVNWLSFANPDHFELAYKLYDSPAASWQIINVEADARTYDLGGMDEESWYEIKIGAVYYTPEEVYLESETKLVSLGYSAIDDPLLPPPMLLRNYPNPFHKNTKIEFELKSAGQVELDIYNLKGQKIRKLSQGNYAAGNHNFEWDGCDEKGRPCPKGIYYIRFKSQDNNVTRKMIRF